MDYDQEARFIQAFVRRERRERAQVELRSPKKRSAFFHRLSHVYTTVLDVRYLHPIPPPNSDYRAILTDLRRKQAPETSYVLSSISALDGTFIPLADALARVVGFGMPSIVICIPGMLGYFEAEQSYGPPPRFFLEHAANGRARQPIWSRGTPAW
jgi:hypothetical protein